MWIAMGLLAMLFDELGRPRHQQHNDEVQFYAFDVLMSDGDDLRKLPLSMRKASLARLLARRVNGIFLSDSERGEIGPDLFHHACLMGLEKARRSSLPGRSFAELDQDQKSRTPGNHAGKGCIR
jgi:hypothetical protein